MKLQREWATPVAMGAFGLLAVTGVLMFFHLDSGLNKLAHEWLSWVLVAGVAAHATVNWPALRRHLGNWRARLVLGLALALLLASFWPVPQRERPPLAASVSALAATPLPLLAQVAQVPPDVLRERLQQAGLQPQSDSDTVRSLAGDDLARQARVLAAVVAK